MEKTMKMIIRQMIEKCPGGKAAVAALLGLSEQSFNNRLYQTKGQRFTDEELIVIENEYGVSDWSDEVNRRLGKVSFNVPNVDELDLVELSHLQIKERVANGMLFAKVDELMKGGVINQAEKDVLNKLLHHSQRAQAEIVTSIVALYQSH